MNDTNTVVEAGGGLSRRDLLHVGLAAAGGVALGAAAVAEAGTGSPTGVRGTAPRRFRAWVSRGEGPARTTLQELTLRPIGGRQVVVRTEAANLCYTLSQPMLGIHRAADDIGVTPERRARRERLAAMAIVQGHGGIGIVESVGPDVRRVKPGDRVCVSGTPQCGVCYQCLRGRSDMCQFLGPAQLPENMTPVAQMRDGTPVYMNSEIGGFGELMVTYEEWVVPLTSRAPAGALEVVCSCTSVAGLGATTSQGVALLAPGASVAVVGCGPLGLSAVQGARIAGASTIIAIEPIRRRRELARQLGATHVLDPNEEGSRLVDTVRELTLRGNPSPWGGGRYQGPLGGGGVDFAVEAAGAEWVPPTLERGPDPTGILPMRQSYDMLTGGGHLVTTSLPTGDISFPSGLFSLGGRSHHAGQAGGCSPLRDIPRFASYLDAGQFNALPMLTAPVPLDHVLEAYQEVVHRSTVLAILVV